MKNTFLQDKSFSFSINAVYTYKKLKDVGEYVISRQFLRSSTSIGANIIEAFQAESKKDFIHKLSISLKEAHETKYWLKIIRIHYHDVAYVDLISQCSELIALLTVTLKKHKN